MARVVVLGGTGYAGSAIVTEAVARGHDVTAVSRSAPDHPVDGASYVQGDVSDAAFLRDVLSGQDVVVEATTPQGGRDVLIPLADELGVRLGVLGGAGSLLVAEGGPQLMDTGELPEAFLPAVREAGHKLDDLRATPESLDWFFISPAGSFGSYNPGPARGSYRVSGDVLLTDEQGRSEISAPDLATAFVDEIESPAHHRARFHVAY